MNCPSCGASAPANAEFCPQCLGSMVPAAPVPENAVVPAAPEPPAVEESRAPPAPVAEVPLVPEDAPRCPDHPTMPIAGTCSRCGAFYCIRCVPDAALLKQAICPRCKETQAVREAPEKLRGLYRDLWLSPLIMGVLIGALPGLLWLISQEPKAMGIAILGVVVSLPFFLGAFLIGVTRSLTVAWIGFGIELLGLAVMLLGGGGCCVLLIAAVPLMTMIQIRKIQELEALLRAQPAGQAPRP
jgi:hypothetical protein